MQLHKDVQENPAYASRGYLGAAVIAIANACERTPVNSAISRPGATDRTSAVADTGEEPAAAG